MQKFEREKKEKKMPFIMASSQGQRTHSARTNSMVILCVHLNKTTMVVFKYVINYFLSDLFTLASGHQVRLVRSNTERKRRELELMQER